MPSGYSECTIFYTESSINMIPKVIHYTWFSGDPFPEKIQRCIDSWKKYLPDYTLKLWDMEAIKDIDSVFLKEALAERKWAYAADYVRLYAIYHEGGVYLDTDAIVYKSFDYLLDNHAFIGKENSIHFEGGFTAQYLSSHCFGAERYHPFIKSCLDYYENRHFVTSFNKDLPQQLRYNLVLLPYIQAEIARLYGYDWKPKNQVLQKCKSDLSIYPTEFFDPLKRTENSYCKHLAVGGWRVDKPSEIIYDLKYKISWRLLYPFKWVLRKAGYVSIKID